MLSLLFVVLVIQKSFANPTPDPTLPPTHSLTNPVYRYYQSTVKDHLYTTDANEIGTTTPGQAGTNGYVYEGVGFYLEDSQITGTQPLYRYYSGSDNDHFYTTDGTGKSGYTYEGILGYCFPSQQSGAVPLYRYKYDQSGNIDHFYTTNSAEIGITTIGATANGWTLESIECYVYVTAPSLITPSFEFKPSFQNWPIITDYNNWILFAFIALLIMNVACLMAYFCKNEFGGNKQKAACKVVEYQDNETEKDHLNV